MNTTIAYRWTPPLQMLEDYHSRARVGKTTRAQCSKSFSGSSVITASVASSSSSLDTSSNASSEDYHSRARVDNYTGTMLKIILRCSTVNAIHGSPSVLLGQNIRLTAEAPPRIELGLQESEPYVITNYTMEPSLC